VRRGLLVACIALICAPCAWAAEPDPSADPWKGKSRSEVLTLLGDPTKAKKSENGEELLIYRFVRLDENAVAPVGMAVLNVPGIGVVGRRLGADTREQPEVGIEPTELDKRGHRTGGGVTEQEESHTITWDKEGKHVEPAWEERPATRGKVTLKLWLNRDGEVASWSVSPKKAAAG
jgi:hypothetical protein